MVDRETGDRNREKNGQGASGAAGCSPVIEKGLTEKNSHALFVNFDGLDQMSEREKRKKLGNMDIVMKGFAGLHDSVLLSCMQKETLSKRYPFSFLA